MPIARFQLPDGRVARFHVPDGTSPEDAQKMMSAQMSNISTVKKPGALPADKAAVIGELRKRGAIPSLDNNQPSYFQKGGKFEQILRSGPGANVGMIGGGILAGLSAPVTAGLGVLAAPVGAGLGRAGGAAIDRALLQSLGYDSAPSTIPQALKSGGLQTLNDISSGASAEMLPAAAIKGVGNTARFVQNIVPGGTTNALKLALYDTPVIGKPIEYAVNVAKNAAKNKFLKLEELKKAASVQNKEDLATDFKIQEANRKADFLNNQAVSKTARIENQVYAKSGIKSLPETLGAQPRISAGEELLSSAKNAELSLGKKFDELVTPVINKNANAKVSVEPIRKELVDQLSSGGFIDPKGNIVWKEIGNVRAPELKNYYLKIAQINRDLIKNPTVINLSRKVKEIGSLANFGAASRTGEQKAFGSLYNTARNVLNDSIEVIAGASEKSKIVQAKNLYATNKPIFEFFDSLSNKTSEQIVDSARNFFSGSRINDIISKQPELIKPTSDVIINDLARSYSSPSSFTQAIDKYGRGPLKKLFGEANFNVILSAENKLAQSMKPVASESFKASIPPKPFPYKPSEFIYQNKIQQIQNRFANGEMPKTQEILNYFKYLSSTGSKIGIAKGMDFIQGNKQ